MRDFFANFFRFVSALPNNAVLWILVLFAGMPVQVAGQSRNAPREFREEVTKLIEQVMENENIKGVSLGFVGPDGISWTTGVGYANLNEQISAGPFTVYPVASITKTFTTLAVLQLKEKGRLSLSDPYEKHVPEFSINSRFDETPLVTIKHLLSHYGGIPRDIYKGLMTSDSSQHPDILDYFSNNYLIYPPGVKYSYSNPGVELLGILIERVTGMRYEDYLKENILQPLQISETRFHRGGFEDHRLAKAYAHFDEKDHNEFPVSMKASGGLYSTVRDMTRAMEWILKEGQPGPEVGRALINEMLSDQKTENALDVSFESGWSWILERYPEPFKGVYAYQMGSTLYYNSVLALVPEHQIGVVVMCNTGGVLSNIVGLARGIALFGVQFFEEQPIEFSAPEIKNELEELKPEGKMVDRIKGDYLLESDLVRVLSVMGEVVVRMQGETYRVFYQGDGWFAVDPYFSFSNTVFEDRKVLLINQGGSIFPAGFDVSNDYIVPPNIFELQGSYRLENVNPENEEVFYQEVNLFMDGWLLKIELVLGSEQQKIFGYESATYTLAPISESEMVFGGFGMYKGETIFIQEVESGHRLKFSGLEFFKPGIRKEQ